MAPFRVRPRAPRLLRPGSVQRADARTRQAAGHGVAARRSAALRTLREAEILIATGMVPTGGLGGLWRCSARGLVRLVCWLARVIGSELALSTTFGRPRARFTAFHVLLGDILGVYSLECGLSAMLRAGDASDVDRRCLEGAQKGV